MDHGEYTYGAYPEIERVIIVPGKRNNHHGARCKAAYLHYYA